MIIIVLGQVLHIHVPAVSLNSTSFYQLGNCVTSGTMKAFLFLLYATPTTLVIACLPFVPLLWQHMITALGVSQRDDWARGVWWDWPWSWIVISGPPGRWVVGTVLGFHILEQQRTGTVAESGDTIAQPNLTVFLFVVFGCLLALFAIVSYEHPFVCCLIIPTGSRCNHHEKCSTRFDDA